MVYHKKPGDHIIPGDNKSPTFASVIAKIPVKMKAYVDTTKRANFELMFRMKLAGVTLPTYSESSLNQFQLQANTTYRDEWKKIEDFEYLYFQGQKMGPNGSAYYNNGYYSTDFTTYYNPITGISHEATLGQDDISFGFSSPSSTNQQVLRELECSQTSAKYFSAECFKNRQKYIWSQLSYSVLTK